MLLRTIKVNVGLFLCTSWKCIKGAEEKFHLLLISALNGSKWSASSPSLCATGEELGTNWRGGWVGPQTLVLVFATNWKFDLFPFGSVHCGLAFTGLWIINRGFRRLLYGTQYYYPSIYKYLKKSYENRSPNSWNPGRNSKPCFRYRKPKHCNTRFAISPIRGLVMLDIYSVKHRNGGLLFLVQ